MKQIKEKKNFKMPSAYVIVFIALVITTLLTYFIPISVSDPETGQVYYNAIIGSSGEIIENAGIQPMGIWDILIAPINGFQSASDIAIGLLIIGGFLSVLTSVGALEAGISKMLKHLKGTTFITVCVLFFAVLGTVMGFFEEITAFSLIVVPMFLMAGYDALTAIAVMFVGASIGNMASVINPFATGAAVAAIGNPDLTIGSGIVLRSLTFVLLCIVGIILMSKYASKVKKDIDKLNIKNENDDEKTENDTTVSPEMNGKKAWSLVIFCVAILMLLVGYIPWEDIFGEQVYNIINSPMTLLGSVPILGDILGATHVTPFGEWGFNEFGFIFFIGSIFLLLINRMKVDEFINVFINGAKGLLGVTIILGMARGIALIMGNADQGMSVTFIYWITNTLTNSPIWIFAVLVVIINVLIGLFLQSTSGVSAISMPLLGSVAAAIFATSAIASSGGQIILISAFALGLNFTASIYPSAPIMGTLDLYDVPYNAYLKFMLKCMVPLLIVGTIFILIAPYIGLVM